MNKYVAEILGTLFWFLPVAAAPFWQETNLAFSAPEGFAVEKTS
jgi:hypothetical protein